MENPIDVLVSDCIDDKFPYNKMLSITKAFEGLYLWFAGHYMGKSGRQVNPEILVGAIDIKTNYKLMANLLVFLKKYYIDADYYKSPSTLYRLHSVPEDSEPYVNQKIEFKSIGLMSSWSSIKDPVVSHRMPSSLYDRKDVIVKAKVDPLQIMWTPACSKLCLKVRDVPFGSSSEISSLISAIQGVGAAAFEHEKEYILINNKPVEAVVTSVFNRYGKRVK